MLYFDRTLTKITVEYKQQWTTMLQPTILKMNSTHKRAIGATPFSIMFGRESQYVNLLELMQFPSQIFGVEENIRDDIIDNPNKHEIHNCVDFDAKRILRWDSARDNIIREQVKQKQIFHEKFIQKRYLLVYVCNIM